MRRPAARTSSIVVARNWRQWPREIRVVQRTPRICSRILHSSKEGRVALHGGCLSLSKSAWFNTWRPWQPWRSCRKTRNIACLHRCVVWWQFRWCLGALRRRRHWRLRRYWDLRGCISSLLPRSGRRILDCCLSTHASLLLARLCLDRSRFCLRSLHCHRVHLCLGLRLGFSCFDWNLANVRLCVCILHLDRLPLSDLSRWRMSWPRQE